MNLHLDRPAFMYIIDEISKQNNIRRDVLEKDYYVTLLLKELSQMDNQGYAYFKGGTALYKALRSIRRFSEDIDLTVFVENCPSPNQAQKRLEQITLKFESLQKGKTLENKRGSITCEYLYESMYALDLNDALQRFGRVKIEATNFTISEPTEKIFIAPHLFELASSDRQKIMREVYDVEPFGILTISMERIFIDKIFATEFYYERAKYGDMAKHIYDLTVLFENEKIKLFLKDKNRVAEIVGLKRVEERKRIGGVSENTKIGDFSYFKGLAKNSAFLRAFEEMQRIYVFNEKDKLSADYAIACIAKLHQILADY
jgi:predicted nucleotidyltransferase component of viral defense system